MDLVVDANILFAALIKDGTTIELLFNENIRLFAPEFLLEEFFKHMDEIIGKTKRTEKEFNEIFELLKEIIIIIPLDEFSNFVEHSEKISPDKKDIQYFALALKLNCSIWSNDKALKKQSEINVYNTEDLVKLLL